MPSSLTLIQAIGPTLIGLSFIVPLCYGWFKRPWLSSLSLGWSLFALAFLFELMLKPILALEYIGKEGTKAMAPEHDTSSALLPIILCIGWIPPLTGNFLGKYLRKYQNAKD